MPELSQLSLYSDEGRRKYLCGREVTRFLAAAATYDEATRLFCLLLVFTGCRISEALATTPARLDRDTGRVVFLTLKRRKRVFRAVPVPPRLMAELLRHSLGAAEAPIWNWSRQTAWRRVKAVMRAADINGPQAMPKGLRHGFCVTGAEENVPMTTVQKFVGHASLETTAIYQQAVGREENAFARRLWRRWRVDAN
jgi:integrase